jgi:hypothetical protein
MAALRIKKIDHKWSYSPAMAIAADKKMMEMMADPKGE